MMQRKAKGSLVYEILIVILLILLMGTILYPKSVWENIDRETLLCRENMKIITDAEILYLQTHSSQNYDSSLVPVFEFVQNDSIWQSDSTLFALRDTFYVKSAQEYLRNYHELDMGPARDSAYALIGTGDSPSSPRQIDEFAEKMFSSLLECPTNKKTYEIGIVDTSVIKILKVVCPLNDADIDSINQQFMFKVLGGGRVENHGNVDNTDPSWKETKR